MIFIFGKDMLTLKNKLSFDTVQSFIKPILVLQSWGCLRLLLLTPLIALWNTIWGMLSQDSDTKPKYKKECEFVLLLYDNVTTFTPCVCSVLIKDATRSVPAV